MRGQEGWRRSLALSALLAGLAALLLAVLARDDSHSYRFVFENAGQLVAGDLVRIGGTPAGEIESIELSDGGQAEVEVSVDDEFAPLHAGSTATIRAASLIGVANRYVDVHPGPNFRSELDDGALLSADNTTTIVDLDQVFNALDPPTRAGLEQVIDGFAAWYGGRERQANESAACSSGSARRSMPRNGACRPSSACSARSRRCSTMPIPSCATSTRCSSTSA
jgi:phospholipid/cholesterol/gamma-HCH transport system substrate-binding protein